MDASPRSTEAMPTRHQVRRPLPSYAQFPVQYVVSADGLMAAEQELTRLIDMRVAFETQPDISAIWQGYIDQRAAAVSEQRDVIGRLKAKLLEKEHPG